MSTLNLENIKHPDSASNNISVDSSGNTIANGKLGVGTNAPVKGVEVQSSSSENDRTLRLAYDGTYYADIAQLGAGGVAYRAFGGLQHSFDIGGTERMRIDSAGRVTMPYQPMFSGYNADGTQTLSRNIHWNTFANVGNHMATSTGVFTCPVAGKYFCSFSSLSQASSGTEIAVLQNGAFNLRMWDDGTDWTQLAGGGILDCSANDTIEFFSNGRLVHTGTYTFASIHLIG